jgi:hypothetical protein
MVRRSRVAGATSEGFSLFSVSGHRELVACLRELNLRKVDAPFLNHERTNHTNVRLTVFSFVLFVLFVVKPLTTLRAKAWFADNAWPVLQAKDLPFFGLWPP